MTSSRLVRAALTEASNAYQDRPQRPEDLHALESILDAVAA